MHAFRKRSGHGLGSERYLGQGEPRCAAALWCSFTSKREDSLPVVLHIHNDPSSRRGCIERLVELPHGGLAVVSPLPFGIGVMHDKAKAGTTPSRGVLQH